MNNGCKLLTSRLMESPSNAKSIEETKVPSKNQIKNEIKRKEKLEKFYAKQEKLAISKNIDPTLKASSKRDVRKSDTKNDIPDISFKDGDYKGTSYSFIVDVSKYDLPTSYHPKYVERNWYSWWESQGFFRPEAVLEKNPNAPIYIIPIPPPNVTGSLHLGHAMATSIQDALIRWKRMTGYASLYIPGCDHAGISCQVVVEKHLKKTRNLTRHDLGRLAFIGEVWKWKDAYGDRIYSQLKRLGGSMDWSRARFTLDPGMNEAVTEAFVRLFDEGIIYRANRLVNWSSALQTAVSDLEVDHREISSPIRLPAFGHDPKQTYEFGYLYSFAMKIADDTTGLALENEEIIVSTTRPETIPGDVAVAINANDPRYSRYHGKFAIHPIHKKKIPIICDEIADISFGTGALKITPAHDPNDYEVSLRHNLPVICIFDANNRLNDNAGPVFAGMMRFDAREAIISYLETEGLLRGKQEHHLELPICNRSGDIIEPRILPQWWMKCTDLATRSVNVVRSGELTILPKEAEKIWFNWLENCKDWCLSRQLWWGHRIPAYSVQTFDQEKNSFNHVKWVASRSEEEAFKIGTKEFPNTELRIEQDPDVLDTWFSSALWPFAILGWPNSTADLKQYYPASVLETGRDIIFFWVARMVMMGLKLTNQVPFKLIYLHSIVRDAHGRKMSKSLGNVVDPIDVIEGISLEELHQSLEEGNLDPSEIARAKASQKKDFPKGIEECGSDALRFSLLAYTSQGSDVNLDIQRVAGYRRFCNKIWNLAKFILTSLSVEPHKNVIPFEYLLDIAGPIDDDIFSTFSLFDQWILSRLCKTIIDLNAAMEEFNFMKATSTIYSFVLYDVCDVYLEAIKPHLSAESNHVKTILVFLLDQSLKMLHPFMPFITEELWQKMIKTLKINTPPMSISLSSFPTEKAFLKIFSSKIPFNDAEKNIFAIQQLIRAARSMANDLNSKSNVVEICCDESTITDMLTKESESICSIIKGVKSFHIGDSLDANDVKTAPSLSEAVFPVSETRSSIVSLEQHGIKAKVSVFSLQQ